MEIETAIVSGAASFTGVALIERLLSYGIKIYALVRPKSKHNDRLREIQGDISIVEASPKEYQNISISESYGHMVFFHLLWGGDKGIRNQMQNIEYALASMDLAKRVGCSRWIGTGSQAEYGIVPPEMIMKEDIMCNPITSYGAAKLAACHQSKIYAKELDIEWGWARIFSLIGHREPRGRMLPDLFFSIKKGKKFYMSSGRQNWDYLDVYDAADALISLAKRGTNGEIYNIANGQYKPLKEYTEDIRRIIDDPGTIIYGADPEPFISLQPSIEKIQRDTGWRAKRSFADSVADYGK